MAFLPAPSPGLFRQRRPRSLYTMTAARPSNATTPETRVRFPNLRADRFRHPVDEQMARLALLLGIAEPAVRLALRGVEQVLALENVSRGVLVSSSQLPRLHKLLLEACAVLGMEDRVPALYVRQDATPNAYTLAVQGRKPFIVVHSALLELLDERETQAVLAHELGHLKCEHGVWVAVANIAVAMAPAALSEALQNRLLRWQRAAELSCDRAALLVAQEPRVVMSSLMKLTGGSPKYAHEMDLDAFLKQADLFDKESKSRLGRIVRDAMVASATHPLPILRVRELKRWAESNQFQALIRSGLPLVTDKAVG